MPKLTNRTFQQVSRRRLIPLTGGIAALVAAFAVPAAASAAAVPGAAGAAGAAGAPAVARASATAVTSSAPMHISCDGWSKVQVQCPDVYNPEQAFGHYVGHDEPGVWDYSTQPGSGNHAKWLLTLPKDPPPNPAPGADVYAFETHIAFWFGMDLCATQSFPEQIPTCKPDSDSNIVDPKVSAQHAGSAYLELQFYPPGAALFPSGVSCDATQWCAAMNVWSYYYDPVTGQALNTACQSKVGGIELDNYAFVQMNGVPTGPPDPLQSTAATFTPNDQTLLMGQGDHVGVTVEDSPDGLTVKLNDYSSGRYGTMTASARNGFAQMVFAPNPSTECASTPYTYHPEYSTSSPQTRTTWTAYPYNVAYADETGHFDYCSQVDETSGLCAGQEGAPGDREAADNDDYFCFGPDQMSRDPIGGCFASNYGFDGTPYQDDWPNGQKNRGTPVIFSGPLTGPFLTQNYQQEALAGPLPFIEDGGGLQGCDIYTMTGCTALPLTDDGTTAPFYPFFSTTRVNGCSWAEGDDIPGLTVNDFGGHSQYGTYNKGVYYTGLHGVPYTYASDFLHTFATNPCPSFP